MTMVNNGQGAVQSVPAGVTAAMSFFANGTLEGNGGRNNFSGSYTVEGDSISIGPLMGTRMSCGEQTDTFEFQFLTALENSAKWSVSGGTPTRVTPVAPSRWRQRLPYADAMATATIRPAYSKWADYNKRLREVVGGLTDEQLLLKPSAERWPLWAMIGHALCQRVFDVRLRRRARSRYDLFHQCRLQLPGRRRPGERAQRPATGRGR